MTDFDPYHTWLGIPPEDQPPNYYKLLGLRDFESNLDAISHAADRQLRHVRTFSLGEHSSESQELLNELSRARVCLLTSDRRAEYDESLRLAQTHLLAPVAAPPQPTLPAKIPTNGLSKTRPTPSRSLNRRRRVRNSPRAIVIAVGGGLAALLVASYLVAIIRSGSSPNGHVAGRHTNPATTMRKQLPPVATPQRHADGITEVDTMAEKVAKLMHSEGIGNQRPENALLNLRDEFNCTKESQPQLAIADWFDATRSWRLYMRVSATPNPPDGSLFCWGDQRTGLDPISVKAGKDYISGWVQDNTSNNESVSYFPKVRITWNSWQNVELIYDAHSLTVRVATDTDVKVFPVKQPPRADRTMPVILGGIGIGSDHTFPCRIRDLRLEQVRNNE